ncbi:MAG TPA: hypothetical protein VJ047_11440 [Pseudomonas sp.]|nr:hypothetical protein [Pseudomonas sp.]
MANAYKWVKWTKDGIKFRAKIKKGSAGQDLVDAIEEIEWAGGIPGSHFIPFKMDEATKEWLKDNINDLQDARVPQLNS